MTSAQKIQGALPRRGEAQDGSAARVGKSIVSAGSVLAAVGAASCCLVPFTLAGLGIGGAWIGNFTALAPYQPYFIGSAALLLGLGFLLVYRKRAACPDDAYCARPISDRIAKTVLWTATVLVVMAVAFPYAIPLLFDI